MERGNIFLLLVTGAKFAPLEMPFRRWSKIGEEGENDFDREIEIMVSKAG